MTSDMAGWCRLPWGVAVAVGRVSASVWRSCGGGSGVGFRVAQLWWASLWLEVWGAGVGIRVAQLCGRAYDE